MLGSSYKVCNTASTLFNWSFQLWSHTMCALIDILQVLLKVAFMFDYLLPTHLGVFVLPYYVLSPYNFSDT